jgi:hypothetical protein
MNSRHVKRIASPQANWGQREAYFALAVERRLWRGLRSFPGRPAYGRFPPNCDVHESGRLRPLYVDSGRPLRANSSHSRARWHWLESDPKPTFGLWL